MTFVARTGLLPPELTSVSLMFSTKTSSNRDLFAPDFLAPPSSEPMRFFPSPIPPSPCPASISAGRTASAAMQVRKTQDRCRFVFLFHVWVVVSLGFPRAIICFLIVSFNRLSSLVHRSTECCNEGVLQAPKLLLDISLSYLLARRHIV